MRVKIILRSSGELIATYHTVSVIVGEEPVISHETGKMKFYSTLKWDRSEDGTYPMSPLTIDMEKYIIHVDH